MPPAWPQRPEAVRRDGSVSPAGFADLVERWRACVGPSPHVLATAAGPRPVPLSRQGRLSPWPRPPAEDSATWVEGERWGRPACSGTAPWEPRPWSTVRGGEGGEPVGAPEGGIALAPSRGPQRGPLAGGVQRPWGRPRGTGDQGQGGVVLGEVSRPAQAWLACRVALPAAWARAEPRRQACPGPAQVADRTRHAQGLARRARGGRP